jgi:hypothetical protein
MASPAAELVMPGAVLAGDSVTPPGQPQIDLRIRYHDLVTPCWPQYNTPASRMAARADLVCPDHRSSPTTGCPGMIAGIRGTMRNVSTAALTVARLAAVATPVK